MSDKIKCECPCTICALSPTEHCECGICVEFRIG